MVNVDILPQHLKPRAKKYLKLFVYILILIFLFLMVYYGFYLAYSSRFLTFQGIPFLSYTWATLSMPIPSIFMIITTCLKIRDLLKKDSADGSVEVR